jgi:hypothetical protein
VSGAKAAGIGGFMTDSTPTPPRPNFNDVLFILDGKEVDIDPNCRYVYNDNGHTEHLLDPKGTLIPVTPEDGSLSQGQLYGGITWTEKEIGYTLVEFDFHPPSGTVSYQPIWADTKTCQAFGITLLRPGQCLPFQYSGMVKTPYTYGVYAGYQSPYIGSDRDRELLTINATDLEYHDFPHIFASQDSLPLVISVARWRPKRREILLADLWVNPGDCLFIPPKKYNDVYTAEYADMHGNRNSAFACWGLDGKDRLATETTLGNAQVFKEKAPHYHEEKCPTVHSQPS